MKKALPILASILLGVIAHEGLHYIQLSECPYTNPVAIRFYPNCSHGEYIPELVCVIFKYTTDNITVINDIEYNIIPAWEAQAYTIQGIVTSLGILYAITR